jgi:hypothetical protein
MLLSEDDVLEITAFLVTAARCLMDEPVDYGPMRLLTAAERLCARAAPDCEDPGTRAFFQRLAQDVPPQLGRRNGDPDGYVRFMDECCRSVARELLRRAGRGDGR